MPHPHFFGLPPAALPDCSAAADALIVQANSPSRPEPAALMALRLFINLPRILCVALTGLAALMAVPGNAYEVSPMRVFLQPSRGQTSTSITVSNTRAEDLMVEVNIFRRHVEPDGSQQFEPADDLFIVFPPQAQIASQKSQAIRVQFIGTLGDASEAYVIQITEVPVNSLDGTGIQFTYNFGVAVYVEPDRAKARIGVTEPVMDEGSLKFSITNSGNAFGFINDQALEYKIGEQVFRIEQDTLNDLFQNPIIPPNSARNFALPLEGIADGTPVTLRLLGDRT